MLRTQLDISVDVKSEATIDRKAFCTHLPAPFVVASLTIALQRGGYNDGEPGITDIYPGSRNRNDNRSLSAIKHHVFE